MFSFVRVRCPNVPRALAVVLALAVWALFGDTAFASEDRTLTGRLELAWGDPLPGASDESPRLLYTLRTDSGPRIGLSIRRELGKANGGFLDWQGRRVEVRLEGDDAGVSDSSRTSEPVTAISLLHDDRADLRAVGTTRTIVTGSQPWVSLLCRFADYPTEPEDLDYFLGMYSDDYGGLGHYWREQSYDKIDVAGSTAVDWVDLPAARDAYIDSESGYADLNRLFDDCTAALDSTVDFSNGGAGGFVGINLMFNDVLDCCAWGGGRYAALDGVEKVWRTTWNPPWSFRSEAVIAHEMGHGFGLPHANNWDDDGNPYDSPWDVMSSASGYSVHDPTYGPLGKHHLAYHKNRLGWFDAGEVLDVEGQVTAILDPLGSASTTHYRMAKLSIPNASTWYTVEVRDLLGYDGAVPGNAVIITQVDPSRSEPAWVVDAEEPPKDYGDGEGTMFRAGETFSDEQNGFQVQVDFSVGDGFQITLTTPSILIFADGFEVGSHSTWSTSVP